MSSRIHILGASGSGTSTLGRTLAADLGVPHHDTDDFYWLPTDPPYREPRPQDERLRLLEPRLRASGGWVLSGSSCGWGDPLIRYYDLVVFLLVPTALRLRRLAAREAGRYGQAAIAPGGPMHAQHREFLDWAGGYDDGPAPMRSLASHRAWLARLSCPVLELGDAAPVEAHVDDVRQHLST